MEPNKLYTVLYSLYISRNRKVF